MDEGWLGARNHFVADRVNRLLLSTYGRQLVSTTLQHGYDAGEVLVADKLGATERETAAETRNRLSVRRFASHHWDYRWSARISMAPRRIRCRRSAKPSALLKFSSVDGVSRVFDDGYAIVYDVRGISGRR